MPAFRCPACGGADVEVVAGDEFEVESIEVEEERMHRTKVRVVEDALDANNTIAPANRADFDRAGVTVVEPDERAGRGQDDAARARARRGLGGVRVGVLEGDVQGSMDADRLARLHVPVTQLNTDSGFGGECHLDANMVRSALPALPLDEIDLLVIENVGNLVCPAEFRVGEDARVMVSSVTEGEDKPLKYPLMFRACELVRGQQDRPAAAPRLRPRQLPVQPRRRCTPACERMLVSARTGEGDRRVARLAARGARGAGGGRVTRGRRRRATCVGAALAERTRANAALLRGGGRAARRLCHRMAERFARGGRLLAFGASPAARSDVRHVAVEFVHPVIVGKRALPAIGLAGEGGPARRRGRRCVAEPGRHRDRLRRAGGRRRAGRVRARRAAA